MIQFEGFPRFSCWFTVHLAGVQRCPSRKGMQCGPMVAISPSQRKPAGQRRHQPHKRFTTKRRPTTMLCLWDSRFRAFGDLRTGVSRRLHHGFPLQVGHSWEQRQCYAALCQCFGYGQSCCSEAALESRLLVDRNRVVHRRLYPALLHLNTEPFPFGVLHHVEMETVFCIR